MKSVKFRSKLTFKLLFVVNFSFKDVKFTPNRSVALHLEPQYGDIGCNATCTSALQTKLFRAKTYNFIAKGHNKIGLSVFFYKQICSNLQKKVENLKQITLRDRLQFFLKTYIRVCSNSPSPLKTKKKKGKQKRRVERPLIQLIYLHT